MGQHGSPQDGTLGKNLVKPASKWAKQKALPGTLEKSPLLPDSLGFQGQALIKEEEK